MFRSPNRAQTSGLSVCRTAMNLNGTTSKDDWLAQFRMESPFKGCRFKVRVKWEWLKIKQEGLRRFWSMFPLTRVPVSYRFFEHSQMGEPFARGFGFSQGQWYGVTVSCWDSLNRTTKSPVPPSRPAVNLTCGGFNQAAGHK